MINLWFPKLNWTNEAQVVKQSVPVFINTFGGMGVVALMFFLMEQTKNLISDNLFLLLFIVFYIIVGTVFTLLVKYRGKKIFYNL